MISPDKNIYGIFKPSKHTIRVMFTTLILLSLSAGFLSAVTPCQAADLKADLKAGLEKSGLKKIKTDAFMPVFFIKTGNEKDQVAFNMDENAVMPGYLQGPSAGAADTDKNIYIADTLKQRILKYSSIGALKDVFDLKKICEGQGLKYPPLPIDLAVNAEGTLITADAANNRIILINSEKKLIRIIGNDGTGPGQFRQINKLHCDRKNYVYVEDISSTRSLCFDLKGNFMLGYKGLTNITVDPWGNIYQPVYLDDRYSRNVAVYDINGNLVENNIRVKFNEPVQYVTMPGVDKQGNAVICCDTPSFRHYVIKDPKNRLVKKYTVQKINEGFAMIRRVDRS